MSLFITGTDTNVGKTVVAAWLCMQLKADYWKPIQTGLVESSDSKTVMRLSKVKSHPEAYRFQKPISPHAAAAAEGITIDLAKIQKPLSSNLIVEGAGGVLTPINDRYFMVDLILQLGFPAVVVARTSLGTINHTCLTIEALRHRKIEIAGIILNGPEDLENQVAIENYARVPILARLDYLKDLSFDSLKLIDIPKTIQRAYDGKDARISR